MAIQLLALSRLAYAYELEYPIVDFPRFEFVQCVVLFTLHTLLILKRSTKVCMGRTWFKMGSQAAEINLPEQHFLNVGRYG
jgi:hypothetical protein